MCTASHVCCCLYEYSILWTTGCGPWQTQSCSHCCRHTLEWVEQLSECNDVYPSTVHPSVRVCVQVEKEVVKAIRQMEEVEVEVKKKKEVSSRVKQLRRQVSVTAFESLEVVTHDK